jgi:hypothetical protein
VARCGPQRFSQEECASRARHPSRLRRWMASTSHPATQPDEPSSSSRVASANNAARRRSIDRRAVVVLGARTERTVRDSAQRFTAPRPIYWVFPGSELGAVAQKMLDRAGRLGPRRAVATDDDNVAATAL